MFPVCYSDLLTEANFSEKRTTTKDNNNYKGQQQQQRTTITTKDTVFDLVCLILLSGANRTLLCINLTLIDVCRDTVQINTKYYDRE